MRTIERKTTQKSARNSATLETVTIRIPARVSHLLKYHNVTPDKFVGDVWKAVSATENLSETLTDLYPRSGKPGSVIGLFVIRGE
jgi:hypothetical protein